MDKIIYALKVLRKRGISFFWTYFWESVWFDLSNGTSTSSRVTKDNQNITSTPEEQENGLLYVASFTSVTKKTTRIARDTIGAETFRKSQFFDLGCGKGKALFVYALDYKGGYDFPAVGIEYDAPLAEMGERNLQKLGLKSDQVKIVADSATNLKTYLEAETAIIYLYNSFQGETLYQVLTELKTVPHILIYVDPVEKARLPEFGYSIIAENQGKYNADTWLVAQQNA